MTGHWGRESGIISCIGGVKEVDRFNQTRHIDPGQDTRTIQMDTMRSWTDRYTNDLITLILFATGVSLYAFSSLILPIVFHFKMVSG